MNIIITESQYTKIVEEGKHIITSSYEVLDSKYGYEEDDWDDWAVIVKFLLKVTIENKTYEYVFNVGGNVTQDDEWEIEEDRIDWDIIGDNNFLMSVNGMEVNMKLNSDQINEVVFSTNYSVIEDEISEIYHNLY